MNTNPDLENIFSEVLQNFVFLRVFIWNLQIFFLTPFLQIR